MLAYKYLILAAAMVMFVAAAAVVIYDVCVAGRYRRAIVEDPVASPRPQSFRWRTTVALLVLAWAPLLMAAIGRWSLVSH